MTRPRSKGRRCLAGLLPALTLLPVAFAHVGSAITPSSSPPATPAAGWLSGWPTARHDPMGTNRSPVAGPTTLRLLVRRKGVSITRIDANGVMYGCQRGQDAVSLDTNRHIHRLYRSCLLLAIAPDGTLLGTGYDLPPNYRGSEESFQYSTILGLSPLGIVLWKFTQVGLFKGAVPLAGPDDRFYVPVVGDQNERYQGLNVISSTGTVIRHDPTSVYLLAVSSDGTTYSSDVVGNEAVLQARNSHGVLLWQYRLHDGQGPDNLVLNEDGSSYVGEARDLVALDTSGRRRWHFLTRHRILALAERADGVVLAADRDRLYAIGSGGALLWKRWIADIPPIVGRTIMVDAAGKVYIGSLDGKLRIIGRNGRLLAAIPTGGRGPLPPNTLLTPRGELVVNGEDGVLRVYAPQSERRS